MILLELISDKEKYFNIIKNNWVAAHDTFPEFLTEISAQTKYENENYITAISTDFHNQIKKFRRISFGKKKWVKNTFHLLNNILCNEEILGMHHYMSRSDTDALIGELMEFMRKVRKFAPELSIADIGQAIRNYIVYTMFKKMHLIDSGFSLAGFGYSMLYPVTDNYIDNETLSVQDKDEYNKIIRDKIEGRSIYPKTKHQKKTCQLLQYIEDQYPRDRESCVFGLLLMMLDAQEKSLKQQNRKLPLTYQERLDISVYKGGISVLLDRFLVNKELTKEDLLFYLGFGYFLQLADDLQDIKEDSDLGYSTLFTLNPSCTHGERTVNKLLHFVHQITKEYPAENHPLKQFLLNNSYQLIFSSIIRSKEFFSREYLEKLEKYLPVTYSYWEELSKNRTEDMNASVQKQYMNLLDELIKKY